MISSIRSIWARDFPCCCCRRFSWERCSPICAAVLPDGKARRCRWAELWGITQGCCFIWMIGICARPPMTGMAAFFAALFGTPLAATVFAMMVISIGVIYHAAFIPCLTASLVAYGVSILMGVEPTHFAMTAPELELWMLVRVAVLAALCALVCVLLCGTLHTVEKWMHAHLANPWLRILAGGAAVVALTHLCGTTDYNGAGMEVIAAAVEQGQARPLAFLLKIVFTSITLAAGFKGGEVVPSFFVGATFGCAVGPLLGIPAEFAAAIGLVAVFCGAVNCPLASIFLSVELFGDGGLLYFALACGISYMLSGYNGLYSSQTILYSKLKAEYINVHTNSHHAGRPMPSPPPRAVCGIGRNKLPPPRGILSKDKTAREVFFYARYAGNWIHGAQCRGIHCGAVFAGKADWSAAGIPDDPVRLCRGNYHWIGGGGAGC